MANHLNITIEFADDYRPGDRLQAAIRELDEALADAHGDDTAGFENFYTWHEDFVFHTITWTLHGAGPIVRSVAPRGASAGNASGLLTEIGFPQ
jgi:hypothetical protein